MSESKWSAIATTTKREVRPSRCEGRFCPFCGRATLYRFDVKTGCRCASLETAIWFYGCTTCHKVLSLMPAAREPDAGQESALYIAGESDALRAALGEGE